MNRSAREGKSVKRFERSNGPDIALYKNYLYLYLYLYMKQHVMFIHAISGCDTVLAPYMKGEKRVLEVLRSYGDQDSLSIFTVRLNVLQMSEKGSC